MFHSRSTVGAAVAALVLTVGPAVGSAVVLAVGPAIGLAASGLEPLFQAAVAVQPVPLDVVDVIQRVDRILETVVDLVRTLNRLFGEGAGGE